MGYMDLTVFEGNSFSHGPETATGGITLFTLTDNSHVQTFPCTIFPTNSTCNGSYVRIPIHLGASFRVSTAAQVSLTYSNSSSQLPLFANVLKQSDATFNLYELDGSPVAATVAPEASTIRGGMQSALDKREHQSRASI